MRFASIYSQRSALCSPALCALLLAQCALLLYIASALRFATQRSALCSSSFERAVHLSALCALLVFLYQRSALCSLPFASALRFAPLPLYEYNQLHLAAVFLPSCLCHLGALGKLITVVIMWSYAVCSVLNGHVVEVIKEYDNYDQAARRLPQMNAKFGMLNRMSYAEVFVIIAASRA